MTLVLPKSCRGVVVCISRIILEVCHVKVMCGPQKRLPWFGDNVGITNPLFNSTVAPTRPRIESERGALVQLLCRQ